MKTNSLAATGTEVWHGDTGLAIGDFHNIFIDEVKVSKPL